LISLHRLWSLSMIALIHSAWSLVNNIWIQLAV
jgi:hypothetical protein